MGGEEGDRGGWGQEGSVKMALSVQVTPHPSLTVGTLRGRTYRSICSTVNIIVYSSPTAILSAGLWLPNCYS